MQEVAGLHRTCTVVAPTSMPGQREDVQTGASILTFPPTGQRVKYSASGALMHASILSDSEEEQCCCFGIEAGFFSLRCTRVGLGKVAAIR